ncbi:hypothetical protein E2C01_026947 [Portunus trituberculatus]|uniref:Uncharacterized protein n=1 Tax=Portunus trituberculatus TaxID=210409 RepID=A0A5B7EHG5_PORTR|nr:hypothetical protein [Portunus trituberculatus]
MFVLVFVCDDVHALCRNSESGPSRKTEWLLTVAGSCFLSKAAAHPASAQRAEVQRDSSSPGCMSI